MNFLQGTEEYYKNFIELQEKLRKSEEERLKLEMKYNEMMEIAREEEHQYYRKLKNQYKQFLEENHLRQERNARIYRLMERIESRAAILEAKTERFNFLRKQYYVHLKRKEAPIEAKKETPTDPSIILNKYLQDLKPEYKFENQASLVEDILKTIHAKKKEELYHSRDYLNDIGDNERFPGNKSFQGKPLEDRTYIGGYNRDLGDESKLKMIYDYDNYDSSDGGSKDLDESLRNIRLDKSLVKKGGVGSVSVQGIEDYSTKNEDVDQSKVRFVEDQKVDDFGHKIVKKDLSQMDDESSSIDEHISCGDQKYSEASSTLLNDDQNQPQKQSLEKQNESKTTNDSKQLDHNQHGFEKESLDPYVYDPNSSALKESHVEKQINATEVNVANNSKPPQVLEQNSLTLDKNQSKTCDQNQTFPNQVATPSHQTISDSNLARHDLKQTSYDQNQTTYDQNQASFDQNQATNDQNQTVYEHNKDQNEPAYDQNEPAYEQNEPTYDQQKPINDRQQPISNQPQQPISNQQQPINNQQQPMNNQQQPINDQQLPINDHHQASYDQHQPTYNQNQGIYDQNQASYDQNQAFADNQSLYDPNQPSYAQDQATHDQNYYDENGHAIPYDENGRRLYYDEQGRAFVYEGDAIKYYDKIDVDGQLLQYDQNGKILKYDEHGQQIIYDENGASISYGNEENQVKIDDREADYVQAQVEDPRVVATYEETPRNKSYKNWRHLAQNLPRYNYQSYNQDQNYPENQGQINAQVYDQNINNNQNNQGEISEQIYDQSSNLDQVYAGDQGYNPVASNGQAVDQNINAQVLDLSNGEVCNQNGQVFEGNSDQAYDLNSEVASADNFENNNEGFEQTSGDIYKTPNQDVFDQSGVGDQAPYDPNNQDQAYQYDESGRAFYYDENGQAVYYEQEQGGYYQEGDQNAYFNEEGVDQTGAQYLEQGFVDDQNSGDNADANQSAGDVYMDTSDVSFSQGVAEGVAETPGVGKSKVMNLLETDSESTHEGTKKASNDSDFDFSNN